MPSRRWLLCSSLAAGLMSVSLAGADAETTLYENWNPDACGLTDVATIQVGGPVNVRRLEFWYNWRRNERSVDYTVLFNAEQIGTGTLTRGQCDPYQSAWCVAQVSLDAQLSTGVYTFRTARRQLCQNAASGGLGFLRVIGD